jgi:HEAT repeat protein
MSAGQRVTASLLVCVFLTGCGGPSTETTKLGEPVNVALQATAGEPIQLAAADALGRIGEPAVPALTEALFDGNAVVRLQAARALGYMGAQATAAVPALERALHDQDEAVRQQAALALGQIGPPAAPAVPSLLQMLKMGASAPASTSGNLVPPPVPSPTPLPTRQP